MKYLARVALGTALVGGTLLSSGTGHADPAKPAPQCAMPDQLMGKFLILRGNTRSAPLAPPDYSIVVMRFPTADKQQYMVVGTGIWHDGSYRYKVPAPGTAVIDSTQTDTPQPITYSLALRCHDNVTGDYRYTTGHSPEAGPEHTAAYRFQNTAP
ncbi:hypothetical protein K7711_36135 [Nocardia sp. CA2R105]|uniref:hypothetical protein n=1 Tax=Nocardia coffeae TaxID=2873381 RepID=UPI001CA799D9|nr:hypothetical protein [Nocardia coffeae]MBY8861952.1 hypothetical protein [Nocardia coffeae]